MDHMTVSTAFVYSRKIHRVITFLIALAGAIMVLTGLGMEEAAEGAVLPVPYGQVRQLHELMAKPFAVLFGIQALTGVLLYVMPGLLRKARPTQ